jgi:hypothetical protein
VRNIYIETIDIILIDSDTHLNYGFAKLKQKRIKWAMMNSSSRHHGFQAL